MMEFLQVFAALNTITQASRDTLLRGSDANREAILNRAEAKQAEEPFQVSDESLSGLGKGVLEDLTHRLRSGRRDQGHDSGELAPPEGSNSGTNSITITGKIDTQRDS